MNLVTRDVVAMPWYTGESVVEVLESVYVGGDRNLVDLRLPVQYVIRAADGTRALAGQVASGVLRQGDELMVMPSRAVVRVKASMLSRVPGPAERLAIVATISA